MGWSIGWDSNWKRDIGYGVPCTCDHPDCKEQIHRGLSYVCGGEPHGGEDGCGLFFCSKHLYLGVDGKEHQVCERCKEERMPFDPKPDLRQWVIHKLRDASWAQWRDQHPKAVARMKKMLVRKEFPMSESAISRVHVVMTRNMDMQSLCRMSHLDLAIDARVKVEKMRAYLLELENRKFIAVFRPRLGGRRAVYRVLKPAERVLEN